MPIKTTRNPSQRPGTGLRITKRDLQVLHTLHQLQLAREACLHALHFPAVKHQRTVQACLKRLADARLIGRRFLPPIHRLNDTFIDYSRPDRSGAIYFLARAGAELIHKDHNPAAPKTRLYHLHHRLDLSDLRACFHMALQHAPGITLACWIDENQKDEQGRFMLHDRVTVQGPDTGRARKLPIRPDACFILQELQSGKQELFFVECDQGTESGRKRWRDKVSAYRAYSRQGFGDRYHFNGRGFRVLTVCRTPTGAHQDKRAATLLENTLASHGRKQFWITTFRSLMPEGRPTGDTALSACIWQRASDQCPRLALSDYLFDRDFSRGNDRIRAL